MICSMRCMNYIIIMDMSTSLSNTKENKNFHNIKILILGIILLTLGVYYFHGLIKIPEISVASDEESLRGHFYQHQDKFKNVARVWANDTSRPVRMACRDNKRAHSYSAYLSELQVDCISSRLYNVIEFIVYRGIDSTYGYIYIPTKEHGEYDSLTRLEDNWYIFRD